MMIRPLTALAAAAALAGCVTTQDDTPADTPRGGFAQAAADAQRFCVTQGPSFAGTEAAVQAAGGARIEQGQGRSGYRLPSGNTMSLDTRSPFPQCVIYTQTGRTAPEIWAAMDAQPGLTPVPEIAEIIALPGQPVLRFRNSWRADANRVAVRVGGVPGGLMTIVVQDLQAGGLNTTRGGLTAPVIAN